MQPVRFLEVSNATYFGGVVLPELSVELFGMLPPLLDGVCEFMPLPLFIEPLLPIEPLFVPLIDEFPELLPFMDEDGDEDGELLIEPLFMAPLFVELSLPPCIPDDPGLDSCC